MRTLRGLLVAATGLVPLAAHADPVTSYYFFGDSLADEGRAGRTAPVIWAEVLRNDLSITSGQNFAIGGAISGKKARATFGNSGFLGRGQKLQGALYASATYPRLFLDGIVAGGSASLDQTRDGVFGSLHAAPRAGLLTATGRVGYLVPVGPVKLGPVGGLLYTRSSVGGTTESGPAFYAIGPDGATASSLYGQGGAEFRLADPAFLVVDPFVTVTYNHQFDRTAGVIGSYLAFLPTQSLTGTAYTPNLDFVKVAVGSTFELGPRWYGTVTAFGLKGANNLAAGGGNLGLAHRF